MSGGATRLRRWTAFPAAIAVAVTTLGLATASPAAAEGSEPCANPPKVYKGMPWSLERILLDDLWKQSMGEGVRVAVIDTGVDVKHPQLKRAVDAGSGLNTLPKGKPKKNEQPVTRGKQNGTTDTVGHGTKVAGIIAARRSTDTKFAGLAPQSTIIPIRQNDENGRGTAKTLAQAIDHAVSKKADVINISQDTTEALKPDSVLKESVDKALAADVVVVASAGNDGLGGNVKETYPASFDGVLAVASSDRNNERAPFSQSGEFVGVAAPGVDMVSTMPGGGHCADNGTSFSAPYVAGVAALIKAEHKDWTRQQIVAQIEQTAERSVAGHDRLVGWGVVDPLRALTEDEKPIEEPTPDEGISQAEAPTPAKLQLGETTQERNERIGTYAVVGGGVLVIVIAGGAQIYRDWRRRTGRVMDGSDASA
nr:type VII secretion-associated serine protease mycosin [Streptomyces albidus (ex Kaewkla and Franco 2022)]